MLSSSAFLSCCFGVQEVGTCTPILTGSAKTERGLNAGHLPAVQRHGFTGGLNIERAGYINESENSNSPHLKHFLSSNVAY